MQTTIENGKVKISDGVKTTIYTIKENGDLEKTAEMIGKIKVWTRPTTNTQIKYEN